MSSRHLLHFQAPWAGEPLCSGLEITLVPGQYIGLAHFHARVTVALTRPREKLLGASRETLLGCTVTIDGKTYDRQQFVLSRYDIGKTLFCAGFPCLTVTGIEEDSGTVIVTYSEIVVPCDPRQSADEKALFSKEGVFVWN